MSFLAADTDAELAVHAPMLGAISRELPRANGLGEARQLVDLLPATETLHTLSHSARVQAFKVVSFLGHSYIWSSPSGYDLIPERLALPWIWLGRQCGLPPVLTYSSYVLDNWERSATSALVPNLTFTGTQDEFWFILVHQQIERAGSDIRAVADRFVIAPQPAGEELSDIRRIADCLEAMCTEARRMSERCDPYVYFNRIRRFLYGWKWNPLFLGRSMSYAGMDRSDLPDEGQYSGETGAQSPLLHVVDELLGTRHAEPFYGYSQAMRGYMYGEHRNAIARAAESGPIDPFTCNRLDPGQYARALEGLIEFRSIHLDFAKRYVVFRGEDGHDQEVAGTGGSAILEVLGSARKAVEERRKQV